jgi:hypothetical protein
MAQYYSYSFKSIRGSIVNPVFNVVIPLQGGEVGAASIRITMSQERTRHMVAADGTVMVSYVAGNNGAIEIACQQTSSLHQELLALYNLAVLASESGDSTGWAATTISIRGDLLQHICSGVSFAKKPDIPYQDSGQNVTWNLMAADVQTV